MLKAIISKYVSFVTRYFIPCTLLVAALTYYAVPNAVNLFRNIKTEFKSLLPDESASVKRLDEVMKIFGSVKDVIVIIETREPDKAEVLVTKLGEYLKEDPEVKKVDWQKRGYDFFDKHKLYFLSAEDLADMRDRIDRRIQREKLGKLYIDLEGDDEDESDDFKLFGDKVSSEYAANVTSEYLVNKDKTIFLIRLNPVNEKIDAKFFKRFSKHIQDRVKAFGIAGYDKTARVHYAGGVITGALQYEGVIRDLKLAGIVSGCLILLLIIIYYRCVRSVIFVILPLACGMVWNYAIAYFTIGNLNMITAFLASILFGLGIDFGIHLNSRYNEERASGKDLSSALAVMLEYTGRSTFTACMTTATAFLVLIINDFKGFSEFGLIAGTGIIVTLFAYVVILPLLFSIEEKVSVIRRKRFNVTDWHLRSIVDLPRRVMLAALVITVIMAVASSAAFLKFDYDLANFDAPDPELKTAKELYTEVARSRAIPSVVLVHSDEDARTVKRALEERIRNNPKTVLKGVRNIHSLVPTHQGEKQPIVREIGELFDDDLIEKVLKGEKRELVDNIRMSAQTDPFTYNDVPDELKYLFIDEETGPKNQLVYVFLKQDVDLKDGNNALALAEETRDIDVGGGKTYQGTSSAIVFADVLSVMMKDSPKAIIASLIAVFLLLLIDIRNIKHTLIVMIPLMSGVCIMLGIMSVIGLHLSFYNMIVLPVIFGIGIDNGVHFFHRFKEEGYGNIPKVIRTTGGAIVMTSVTTACGFAGMLVAHHRGLASIGAAAIIGIACCLTSTLLFMPAILSYIRKGRS